MDEVELLQANTHYAHIRYPNGKEDTVSLKHLAPLPDHKALRGDYAQSRGEDKEQNPGTVEDAVSQPIFSEAVMMADESSPKDEAVSPPQPECGEDNTGLRRSSRIRRPPIRYEAT